MVLEIKKGSNFYMKRSSSSILEHYQYMMDTTPDQLTLQNMEKGSGESYKEYAVRWKNVASLGQPPLTNREENSIFMDTLPS